MRISYQTTSNQALHTERYKQVSEKMVKKKRKDIPTKYSKKITDTKNTDNCTKTHTNE